MTVKRFFSGNHILMVVTAIGFLANVYLLCVFPSSLILDMFWERMDAEKIKQLDYNIYRIAGLPAGEGIEVLEDKVQFDGIHLGEHFEFYTFETDSIIPLDAYQLKSGTDTNDNTYRTGNGRYQRSTGKQWPKFTDDALEIIRKRNIYNRYYLVALPDGNYVIAYLDDAYYLKYLLTRKVQLPVGYVTTISRGEEKLLQPCLEEYGLEENKILVMFSQKRYEDYKILYKAIPVIVYICAMAVYLGVGSLVLSMIQKAGGKRK